MSSRRADRGRRRGAGDRGALARVAMAWSQLAGTQRRAVVAAVLLLATMFLPWYSRATYAKGARSLQSAHDNVSAIGTFTFVEAAIFLVAVGVVLLMFLRGEDRGFHLPGGDGFIVTAAGSWATFLVFYRFIDQPSGQKSADILYDYGLHWGIFFGLLAALFLAYAGNALRTAHLVEPPLPGGVAPTTGPPPAVAEEADPEPPPHDLRPRATRETAPTLVAPRTPGARRAGEQLTLGDGAAEDPPTERRQPRLPFEEPPAFEDQPPEFPPRRPS